MRRPRHTSRKGRGPKGRKEVGSRHKANLITRNILTPTAPVTLPKSVGFQFLLHRMHYRAFRRGFRLQTVSLVSQRDRRPPVTLCSDAGDPSRPKHPKTQQTHPIVTSGRGSGSTSAFRLSFLPLWARRVHPGSVTACAARNDGRTVHYGLYPLIQLTTVTPSTRAQVPQHEWHLGLFFSAGLSPRTDRGPQDEAWYYCSQKVQIP